MTESRFDVLTAQWFAHAARAPASPALVARDRRAMTFGELAERAHRSAAQLSSWNIRRGDIVVWPVIDREASAAALSVMPLSCTFAPVSAALTGDDCTALLTRLKPKAVALADGDNGSMAVAARELGIAELAISIERNDAVGAFDLTLAQATATLDAPRVVGDDVVYVTMTSGTTDKPKLVPGDAASMLATTLALGERLAVGPGDVSAHGSPIHLANGLRSSYLLMVLQGAAVRVLPDSDVDALIDTIAADEVSYLGASFTLLREVQQQLGERRIASTRLRFIRVTSGRLEPDEIERLTHSFGVPVLAGLASTETGTITHQRLPPAPIRSFSLGPTVACEIRLVDEDGRVVAPGGVGEVEVRGPQVFSGYLDDPELNARSFRDGWFRMGDLARFDEHGELYLVGRRKDIINRGGEKISPAEVDAALRAMAGVADVASFGVPHPRLGEELVAAIVLAPGARPDEAARLRDARARLGARRAPRRLWFVDKLPRTESSKLLRDRLPALVGYDPATVTFDGADDEVPAPSLATELAQLWAATLGVERVGLDEDFFLLGGDSLRGMALLGRVRADYGVEIRVIELFCEASTINSMARWIENARAKAGAVPVAVS